MGTPAQKADRLREIAAEIRANPYARGTIAQGFELIAEAMEPCEDCGHPDIDLNDLPVIDPQDNPSQGV